MLSTPKAVLEAMARSISPDIYKSFTARYTKDIALEVGNHISLPSFFFFLVDWSLLVVCLEFFAPQRKRDYGHAVKALKP